MHLFVRPCLVNNRIFKSSSNPFLQHTLFVVKLSSSSPNQDNLEDLISGIFYISPYLGLPTLSCVFFNYFCFRLWTMNIKKFFSQEYMSEAERVKEVIKRSLQRLGLPLQQKTLNNRFKMTGSCDMT